MSNVWVLANNSLIKSKRLPFTSYDPLLTFSEHFNVTGRGKKLEHLEMGIKGVINLEPFMVIQG